MGQYSIADKSLSAPNETRDPLMVHDGVTGMRTYLSTGVSTLAAIMAAHRITASEITGKPPALQNEIDRITVALTTGQRLRDPC
jgi:hypothetical protein